MDGRDALGPLLRRLRTQAGLSQEKLGSAAGVDARTISDLERAVTRFPRAETAYRIAKALELTGAARDNWLSHASPPAGAAGGAEAQGPDGADRADGADGAATDGLAATGFAAAVRDSRLRRGFTARELSQRTGLTVRTIADIEAGRRRKVHPGNAVRLADELELTGADRELFLRLGAGAAGEELGAGAAGERLGAGAAGEEPVLSGARPPDLFGRERELAQLADRLGRRPLVVLTGPGGVGKTALAEAVLARLDRPHLVLDLTRVAAGEELARAIALVSRFDESTGAAWVDELGAALPPGAVLLLDNLEHLRQVREAVAAIGASRPDITVLATSRTISGLDSGAEFPVGPLRLPAACQVFLDGATRSGRALPASIPAAVIEQVCVRLDQLPLNIVLAAAWSRLMTPREILARLDRSTEILRGAAAPDHQRPGAQPRHATVASTVEWSLVLVSAPARELFRALAAYQVPWPLDLVEAVCPTDRLDPLHELVEAGLVGAGDNDAGGTSYTMLQTVRDVGNRELSSQPNWHGEVLERHAAQVLERALTLGPKLVTAERPAALVECDQLAPHVQGALEYLIRSADEHAVSLAAAWWQYWFHRGQYRRGLAILAQALDLRLAVADGVAVASDAPAAGFAAAPGFAAALDRAKVLYAAAALAYYAGEHQRATRYAQDALARASALGDSRLIGSVVSLIGMMEFYAGHHEAALDWYQRGLAEVDSGSEPQTYATLLTNAAPVYAVLGDIAAARAAAEDAARRCQALGNLAGVAANLGNLAEWAARVGDRDAARELLGDVRKLQESVGDAYNLAQCILSLAKLSVDEGDAATAQEELDAARQQTRGTDDPWGDAFSDALAAQIAVLNGDMTAAGRHARLAVRKGETLGYQPALVAAALADAATAAWSNEPRRTLDAARLGLRHSEQADEAAVVSLALLVAAAGADGTSPAQLADDVLALERLVRQWACVPGCAPYPIAARSARRRGLTIAPGARDLGRSHVPPIGELRALALALCGPESSGM